MSFKKFSHQVVGTSIVYKKMNEQSGVEFHLEENVTAYVTIKVIKLGDVEVSKVDKLTKEPLAGAKIAFDYEEKTEVGETDKNGKAKKEKLRM